MFNLTTHSTNFVYGYLTSDMVKDPLSEETCCCHYMGYSLWLAVRVVLYAWSYRQDSTYHKLCYTSHGALAETRNSSWVHYEESIQQPIAPWADALPQSHISLLWWGWGGGGHYFLNQYIPNNKLQISLWVHVNSSTLTTSITN